MAPKTCSSSSTFPATAAPCKLKKYWSLGRCTSQTKFKTSAKRGASSGRVSCQKRKQLESLPPVCIEQRRRAAFKRDGGDSCYPQPVGKKNLNLRSIYQYLQCINTVDGSEIRLTPWDVAKTL